MKKICLLTVFITLLFFVTKAQPATDSVIRKVTAKEVKAMIDSSTGPLIVNLWASWCGPCIREIPWFDSIMTEKNSTVKLVLVSLDYKSSYPKQLAAFVKKHGYKGEVVFLDEYNPDYFIPAICTKWKGVIPASIFVNHANNYFEVFNQQMTRQRFEWELDRLTRLPAQQVMKSNSQ